MNQVIETLEGNFSERDALRIRREEQQKGYKVNIKRFHSKMVRIDIVKMDRIINVTPKVKQIR